MPGPTDDYFAYQRWFDAGYKTFILPAGCVEVGPDFKYSNQYTWQIKWLLIFSNPETHIQIKENFAKIHGLQKSRRIAFVYHYGPTVRQDLQGMPEGESSHPVFVRIDNTGGFPVHLHPEGKPEEHIPQARIRKLVLEEVDLFDFVNAALRHRSSGKSIAKELGYRIL